MKKGIIVSFLLGLSIFGYSQNEAVISGRIIDKQNAEALSFATIMLLTDPGQEVVTGTFSDEQGRFVLSEIPEGNYMLKCSFVGYDEKQLSLLVGEKNKIFDVGKIELEPQSEQLEEVIVSGDKAVVNADLDRKTFSMDQNFAQSGGSLLDAMKGLPGITVDQDGKVELRGSDRVVILIDGKQSSLTGFGNQQGLDNIPASNIERIEIINNPSAKYDASGMAGIINIIYKKEKSNGLNAELGFKYGLGQLSKRKKDLPTELGSFDLNPKYIPSLNLNYGTARLNTFFQSEILHQKRLPNNEFNTRTYDDGSVILSQVPENRKQTQYILKGGLDWLLDEKNVLSISGIYDYESHIDTAQVPYINQESGMRNRYWHWSEDEVTGFMNYRLDFQHKFNEPGHELNVTTQYTRGWEDEKYFLNDSTAIRQSVDTTHLDATEHTTGLLIDYVKPLRSGRVEAGVKLQIRRIPISYIIGQGEQSIIYPGLGDWSDWGEDLYAGYVNYILEKKKFDVEAGLRIEQVNVFYNFSPDNIYYNQNDAYNYFELYPNVRISFKINDKNSLSAFYNRRVDRPGEPELRLFAKYDDPELLKVGNPYLRPQFTQTIELAYKYNWAQGSAFLSVYHRLIKDPFQRIYSIEASNSDYNVVNRIYQNVGGGTNTGIELLLSQDITRYWKISGSLNWYLNTVDAFEGILFFPDQRTFNIDHTEDTTWDFKINNQLSLPQQTQIQVSFVYLAPKNVPQGKQLSRYSLDLGLKKSVFKNKGELIFSFTDVFNRFGLHQEIQGDGFEVLYENFYETQVFTFGFNYKL